MNKIKYTLLISALFAMMAFSYACAAEDSSEASSDGGSNTLQQVLDRGMLKCGVNDNLAGFGVVAAVGATFDVVSNRVGC